VRVFHVPISIEEPIEVPIAIRNADSTRPRVAAPSTAALFSVDAERTRPPRAARHAPHPDLRRRGSRRRVPAARVRFATPRLRPAQ
jgi:hypothetical protein